MVGENEVLVMVTSSARTVERYLGDVRGEEHLIVGLDVECDQTGKMPLLQIFVGTQCLLF